MQTHLRGPLTCLKIAAHGVSNHALKVGKRVALGGNAPALRVIPPCDETAGLVAGFDLKRDFHGSQDVRNGPAVNAAKGSRRLGGKIDGPLDRLKYRTDIIIGDVLLRQGYGGQFSRARKLVARPGIEPGTQGFSVLCSTN